MNAECEQEGFYGGEEGGLKRKGFCVSRQWADGFLSPLVTPRHYLMNEETSSHFTPRDTKQTNLCQTHSPRNINNTPAFPGDPGGFTPMAN